MARNINMNRIGVPVVSRREDGSMVALDGQHRLYALRLANHDEPLLCDVQEGLTLADEAELFILLQADRKAVRVYDKFKARLVAKDPIALEVQKLVVASGLRIAKAAGPNCVCAIKSVESAHAKYNNLPRVLSILLKWSDGDGSAFDGHLILDLGHFLSEYPKIDVERFIKQLASWSPERVLSKIRRVQGNVDDLARTEAATRVFRDIYNHRARVKLATKKAA
jgi:hypothetical protein